MAERFKDRYYVAVRWDDETRTPKLWQRLNGVWFSLFHICTDVSDNALSDNYDIWEANCVKTVWSKGYVSTYTTSYTVGKRV